MWKVYDAQDGDSVYESEFIEDCAVFVADKEKPERFHIVGGMKAPVWNIEGGLNELAAADVEMFMESMSDGDFSIATDLIRGNPALVDDIISRYRGYMDIDLNAGCGENFDHAVEDAIAVW